MGHPDIRPDFFLIAVLRDFFFSEGGEGDDRKKQTENDQFFCVFFHLKNIYFFFQLNKWYLE